jgi:UPF0755 protein
VRATLPDVPDEDIMARLGREGEHPEGWFLPETYRFPRGTTDLEFLRIAHERMQRALEAPGRSAGRPAAESPYEALILASIIEKETGPGRRATPRSPGVFVRRLERGMRLQTDPTVMYGLGPEHEGRLRRVHLHGYALQHVHPRRPAAHADRVARARVAGRRRAAARRADLYFVATGRPDGSHHFSETLEEHNRAVQRYLATLRERRSGE